MNQSKAEPEPFEYSYYDYSDWYSNNAEPTDPPKEVILPCDPTADDRVFHLLVVLILAVLTRKNKLCQGFTRGSSSVFSPANFLDQTQKKGLVMAVFGLVFSKLAMLVLSPDPLPFSRDTPANLKEYMKIIAIFYYPVLYYPLLLCCTLQHKAGYVLGTLLSFGHFAVLVWQKFDCPKTPEIYMYYALLASLPQLCCLAYLCVQFPLLFVKGPSTDEDLDSSYYTNYVKLLLKKKSSAASYSVFAIRGKVVRCDSQTALLLVVLVVPTLHIVRDGIDENIAFLLLGFGIVLSDDRMEVVQIVTFYTWLLEVCYICAMTLSCLVSLIMLMRSMVLHRSNLKGLYKGDVYSIYNSQKTIRPSKPGIVCWMGLTGYQAAIVCVGMGIQTVVFYICFLFLVFLIVIPVFYGRNLIAFTIAGKAWPVWLTLTLVTALQHVTARFAFIKKEGAYRYYAHSLKVEVSQSHPVMKAFCGLLLDMTIEGGGAARKIREAEEGIQENRPNKAAARRRVVSRWQLLYTLVNNPWLPLIFLRDSALGARMLKLVVRFLSMWYWPLAFRISLWKHIAPRRGTVDTVRRQMLTETMMSRLGTLLLVVNSTWTSQSSPL
ncbi:Stimulated by retinoic acid gene 6 protein [Liparis tanakae]|uniref:Receptor for retinol uptake STRA6 n=1 Tax=Liparis tanakae TaxID=230148 RepID=A0A4Z2GI88_9TELE|nr:Stimulated by retinoic acid gene 6 protein [Liparis tanakae]